MLATFATKYPEPFWHIAFEQLEKCSKNNASLLVTVDRPTWVEGAEALRGDKDTADENVDKTLHCPNASKLDRILDVAMNVEDIKSGSIEELEVRENVASSHSVCLTCSSSSTKFSTSTSMHSTTRLRS